MVRLIFSLFFIFALHAVEMKNGLFLGLGASYNGVKLDGQIHGTSFSSLFSGNSLAALGQTSGSTSPSHTTHFTFAPFGQIGYLHHLSSWLIGIKAAYQYLNLTHTSTNLSFPTSLYSAVGGGNTYLGHLSVGSSQTRLDHELYLLPLFGYVIQESCLYLGAGASLFYTEQHLYDIQSYVEANGTVPDILGSAPSFSFSEWIWGGIAELGWLYPFAKTWCLDLNYSYALTGYSRAQETAIFSNTLITNTVYTETGFISFRTKQRITVQSLTVSLNKVF